MFHDFGITADNFDACLARGMRHRCDFCLQHFGSKSGFEYVSYDQGLSSGSGDGKVVDCPVYCEFSDRATWEAEGLHHKAVGRNRNARTVEGKMCCITQGFARRSKEQRRKESLDEPTAGLAPGTMRHLDLRLAKANRWRRVLSDAVGVQAG